MAGLTNIGIKDAAGATQTIEVYDTGSGGPYGSAVVLFNGVTSVLGVFAEDAPHTSGDTGLLALAVRNDAGTAVAGTTGDYIPITTDANGAVWVNINGVGVAATSLGKAEDAAHTSGDVGVMALTKRTDTAATSAGTDADYATLNTDNTGRLWCNVNLVTPGTAATNLGKAEDAASADGDTGVMVLAVQKAAPADTAGTDGDYGPLQVSGGRLYARAANDGTAWTGAFGVTSAAFTSADASGAAAAVTDAPTATQKIVIDALTVSVGATGQTVSFTCETTGVLIYRVYMAANTTVTIKPTNKIKLATADKKLFVQTSAAGNVSVVAEYHSEP